MRLVAVRGLWVLLSLALTASVACSSDDDDGKGGSSGKGGSDWSTGGSGGDGWGGDGWGGAGGDGGSGGSSDVTCESEMDCPSEKPVCDPVTRTCRAFCTEHSHCTSPDLPQCGEQDCEPCTTNEACEGKAGNPICEPETGRCVACLEDAHCESIASRPFCKDFQCVACTKGEHCPSGVCLSNGTCGPNPSCSAAAPDCDGNRVCHEDRGECLPLCNPELADECPAGWGCQWLGSLNDGTPKGACVPLVDGAGEQRDPCMGPSDCQPNLVCIITPEGPMCTGFCEPDQNACPEDFECLVGRNNSTGDSIHFCSLIELPCEMDEDCEEGRVCTPAAPDARLLCLPKTGTVQAGGSCSGHGDCQSDLCLSDGTCYGPCREDADCGEGGLCGTVSIHYGTDQSGQPVIGTAPVCNLACTLDSDCPPNRACGPTETWGGAVAGGCVYRKQGEGRPGSVCDVNTDCTTGVCLGAPEGDPSLPPGMCFGTCVADADCQWDDAPVQPECVERAFDDLDGGLHVCSGPLCGSESDCAPFREYSCRFATEWVDGEKVLQHRCAPPVGTGRALESCTGDTDCRSGLCLNWGGGMMACYETCSVSADCDQGQCRPIRLDLIENGQIVESLFLDACFPG